MQAYCCAGTRPRGARRRGRGRQLPAPPGQGGAGSDGGKSQSAWRGSSVRTVASSNGSAGPLTRAARRDGAVLPARDLARWWVRGLVNPAAVMRALPGTGWPKAGLVPVRRTGGGQLAGPAC